MRRWPPRTSALQPAALADGAYYEVHVPIDSERAVDACRLEVWGYGGQGIAYVDAVNHAGLHHPVEVMQTRGTVAHAEWLLADDHLACWIGEPDSDLPYYDMDRAREVHAVELAMDNQWP